MARVQSKLSRTLHTHRGKKFLQDLQTLDSTTMRRAMVRLRVVQEKRAMTCAKGLGVSHENSMETPCGARL